MNYTEKEQAFETMQKSLDGLLDHYNRRGNPVTENDFYRLNIVEQEIVFLRQLMEIE